MGVLVVAPAGVDVRQAVGRLYEQHKIGVATGGGGIRLSPHLYNTLYEVDRVVEALAGMKS